MRHRLCDYGELGGWLRGNAYREDNGNDKPAVIGSTNLPEGTELMLTIARKDIGYMAQAKAYVSAGKFQAGPFSNRGTALSPGSYTIEVLTPYVAVQPATVRER